MEGFLDKEDNDFLEFTIKECEAGNPDVVNALLESNFSSISDNSEPSNEEILINSDLPSAGQGFDIPDVVSNNQRVLNSSLSHGSQGYKNGEETTRIPIYDSKISNSIYFMSMQMNVPITYETINSQASSINQENRKTDHEFLCSKLDDGCHGFEMSNGSTIHPVPNDIVKVNTIHAPDRKIYSSYGRMITDNLQPQTIEQGAINSVSAMDTSTTTSQMAFKNSRVAGKYPDYANIKEPHFHNQGMQVLRNLSETIGENAVSNANIFQSPQNETTLCENSRESKEIHVVDDALAFPGQSGIQQNKSALNFSGESFQLSSRLKGFSFEKGICKFCKIEITEHGVVYEGECLYKCCICKFKTKEKENLQIHIKLYPYRHLYCNVCGELYTNASSHCCEQKCKVCGKTFLCKGQLDQHSADHEDYFYDNCRVCKREIIKHVSQDKSNYECCECKYHRLPTRNDLLCHLCTHSDLLISKCHICGKRYRHDKALKAHLRNMHY